MKFSSLMFLSASLLTSQLASADWFFRGTPNTWGSTAMTVVSATQMTTCQTFTSGDATGGPRFKIDKLGSWSESYPSSDYSVNTNQAYKIDFNITTKAITVQTVTSCTASTSSSSSSSVATSISSSKSSASSSTDAWYFRGTPNNWASTTMTLQNGLFCSQQTFGAASTSPRFKVDHFANWTESYPSSDYTVSANTTYNICFNASTHAISLMTMGSSSSSVSSVFSSQISSSVSSSKSSSSAMRSAS